MDEVTFKENAYKSIMEEDIDELALYKLHDGIAELIDKDLTKEQVKKAFMLLPIEIIKEGIHWGFSDTVVGDDMFVFLQDKKDILLLISSDKI